jgi:hypothetical protein
MQRTPKPTLRKSVLASGLILLLVSIVDLVVACNRGPHPKPATTQGEPQVQTAPFSLAVVPTTSFGEKFGSSITMAHSKPRDFYVVLTNTSKEPQAVWEDWNSWGYQAVSFEMMTADGKKYLVSKRQQIFTVNFPSAFLIEPGGHQVYSIRLDIQWESRPPIPKTEEMPITLRAIYEVSPTPESARYKVWTGRIESHIYNLILKQW